VISIFSVLALATETKGMPSAEALYSRSESSVVTILTFDRNRAPLGQGSGFIVAKDRVVTNYHVITGSTFGAIVFSDGSTVNIGPVVSASAPKDLIILEVNVGNRTPLVIGNELELKVGEVVYAIGSPKGLSNSLSNGLVSAFRQEGGQFLIQTTAP